jgi:hypothetical protein
MMEASDGLVGIVIGKNRVIPNLTFGSIQSD